RRREQREISNYIIGEKNNDSEFIFENRPVPFQQYDDRPKHENRARKTAPASGDPLFEPVLRASGDPAQPAPPGVPCFRRFL
ncbi:unnamed protein product, partial [Amoebophrya sp. A120]